MKPIYLDYNATTPIAPEVADAMSPYIREHFGNPSSSHFFGREPRKAVETARRRVADLLRCRPSSIIFTSSATEANNLAIRGVVMSHMAHGGHVITSAVEHSAVLNVCAFCRRMGFKVTIVPVDGTGQVQPDEIERAITRDTILISIMHANNEVGTIQPIKEIGAIAKAHDVLFHCDAAQSVGKIPVHPRRLEVDLLTVAGHKFYAPKGVGALFVLRKDLVENILFGASQESGLRPGTENVIGIVGLGAACALAGKDMTSHAEHLAAMRDKLFQLIRDGCPDVKLNGHPEERLPNTLSLSFPGVTARDMIEAMPELAVSPGAACHSGGVTTSHVLKAMGVPDALAAGTLRFSTGRYTTQEEIHRAARMVADAYSRCKDTSR